MKRGKTFFFRRLHGPREISSARIYHRLTTTSTFGGGVVKVVMVVYRGKPKKESLKKVEEGREGEKVEVEVEEERKQ